jgi:hypothetical protein
MAKRKSATSLTHKVGTDRIERIVCFDRATDKKMEEYLSSHATARGILSRSELVRKAVSRYLKQEDEYWSLMFSAFSKLSDKLDAYTREMDLIKNILMHFLSYYFLNWPQFSPEEKPDIHRRGKIMAANFEDTLIAKLQRGGYLNQLTPDAVKDLVIENQKTLDLDELHAEISKLDEEEAEGGPDRLHKEGAFKK